MPLTLITAVVILVIIVAVLAIRYARVRRQVSELLERLAEQSHLLHDAEQRHSLLFTSNPDPMFLYDCEGLHFLAVNEAAVKAYGYSREEFMEMSIADIRPEEDVASFLTDVGKTQQGYRNAGVWRHRRKDGSVFFVEIVGFEFEQNGKRQKLILANNITERLRMQEELLASRTSLQRLVDNAPLGLSQSFLEEDRLCTINPAFLKMLGGYQLEEALQLRIAKDLYADPRERDRLLEVLCRTGRIEGWETSLRKRDGSTFPVRITGTLSAVDDQKPRTYFIYVEDMTQHSSLERQVRQVQKLEAVGRLAGGMAHDFNNILVVIKLSTELILGEITPDSPFTKPLLQISQAADRAAALTRQMLAFGRQQMMQERVINLNGVVAETTSMLRRVIGEDIELVTRLAPDLANSRLDPDQMTQVILNLAVNARDAMVDGGMLHIETANIELDENYAQHHPPVRPGNYVLLAVSDTGTGIDKSIVPRIFDPFFTTKELGKGTGLGLSIVYGIVKQSGGYIWVYSEPGHGTTFKIYFPSTSASLEKPILRNEAGSRPSGQRILVVDDEPAIRSNIRECLQQMGYRVSEAASGAAALELCEELHGQFDLVLIDLVMPGISGHALATELISIYPELRVLFMSGYTEDSAARRDILLQGSAFLQKPFSVAELDNAIHIALVPKMLVK